MGGRHRTGTLSALYRMEYDRWSATEALDEMYSFDFGRPVPVHEWNIRTYVPRPVPDDDEWDTLSAGLTAVAPTVFASESTGGVSTSGGSTPKGLFLSRSTSGRPVTHATSRYADLVRTLRARLDDPAAKSSVEEAVGAYLRADRPFALSLALRLIDSPEHPLVGDAVAAAERRLRSASAAGASRELVEIESAAALVADFGKTPEQELLLELLEVDRNKTERYEAMVLGVLNRYTPNRIPYLKPLLDDTRPRPDPALAGLRYCDTAFVRLAAITDALPVSSWPLESMREQGQATALKWLDANKEATRLSQLLPPIGNKVVMAGEAPLEEDLSRMRR
jgi:hypothetical protein